MPQCYDKICQNEVLEEHNYCTSCQQKHYPAHPRTLRERPNAFSFKLDPNVKSTISPPDPNDLISLPFDQLKAREKNASEWLHTNAGLKTSDPKKWEIALKRYQYLVKVLNSRAFAG